MVVKSKLETLRKEAHTDTFDIPLLEPPIYPEEFRVVEIPTEFQARALPSTTLNLSKLSHFACNMLMAPQNYLKIMWRRILK
jgi:hypothetical protein